MEANEYTFIYGSKLNAFLKEIQDFQQDKASSDCKRRKSLPEWPEAIMNLQHRELRKPNKWKEKALAEKHSMGLKK